MSGTLTIPGTERKYGANEEGCWFDNHRGIYIGAAVIVEALSHGWNPVGCRLLAHQLDGTRPRAAGGSDEVRYKDYTIPKSGDNYTVNKPNGERLGAEIAATVETAKRWVRMDIAEKANAEYRRQQAERK